MKLNKKGFTLIEALIGFVLFSSLLILYIPSFYQQVQHTITLRQTSHKWRVFYELIHTANEQTQPHLVDSIISQFELETQLTITNYYVDQLSASIQFSDGTQLSIQGDDYETP